MLSDATGVAYATSVASMFSGASAREGLAQLSARLEAAVPTALWTHLESVGRDTDETAFTVWLSRQLVGHPEGVDILWLSLSDMGEELTLCMMRKTASGSIDDGWPDCELVAARDVPEEILQPLNEAMWAVSNDSSATEEIQWVAQTCVPLVWAGLVLGRALQELPTTVLLGQDSARRVAAFCAEGDTIILGNVDASGFHFDEPPNLEAA